MTESREFYGPSVDEAAERAATQLGIDRNDLAYEVLDPGSGGFMGIGARDARILVEFSGSELVPEGPSGDDVEDLDADMPDTPAEPEPPAAREGTSSQERAEEAAVETLPPVTPAPPEGDGNGAVDDVEVPAEVLDHVRKFTESALEGMNIEGKVDVYDAGEFIAVDVASEQTGLFIGQKGETIDALQYLLNVATYRERPFVKRAVLDSEGYRQRRIEAIQGMAHRSARKAMRERRRVELPPMNPSERRIVHLYLQDDDRVSTESEGSGDSRRVIVYPL